VTVTHGASPTRRVLVPEPLTEAAWSPFGWLPVADTDPRDGSHPMVFEWSDPNVNLIGHTRDEVPETPDGVRCDMLYRHDTHTQCLMPVNVRAVVAVAPAAVEFEEESDLETLRAFLLDPLDAFVLFQGTWHWGPFPVEAPEVRLFNVQGLRYAEDNRMADLAAKGLSVDVDLRGATGGS
jgi:ureidoglycolate hydrolase